MTWYGAWWRPTRGLGATTRLGGPKARRGRPAPIETRVAWCWKLGALIALAVLVAWYHAEAGLRSPDGANGPLTYITLLTGITLLGVGAVVTCTGAIVVFWTWGLAAWVLGLMSKAP